MDQNRRVGLLEFLSEYNPNLNATCVLICTFSLVAAMNISLAITLSFYHNELNRSLFDFASFVKFIFSFDNRTVDCVWLSVLSAVLLPGIALHAIQTGQIPDDLNERKSGMKACECFKCFYGKKGKYASVNLTSEDGSSPLLESINNVEDQHVQKKEIVTDSTPREGYESTDALASVDNKAMDEKYLGARKMSQSYMAFWLGILFLMSTVYQVYIGMKCISFEFKNERRDGLLMGLSVLWVNIMTWILRELVVIITKEVGELIPALHPHRLFLNVALASHWCDMCSTQITGGRAYRCKLCDFDMCVRCYAKRNRLAMEGQIRGDKGLREEKTLTNKSYFSRALSLIRSEWPLFAVAILCLIGNNGLGLISPNIQGSILDSVVQADVGRFDQAVRTYLFIAVMTGLIGGVQYLSFIIVGRRLANTVQLRLYKSIIAQDVAFFDGNSSGQLTSRLQNDVSQMVSPIRTMLGTLVSNLILLIGGVGMCFYTSWRLSMLAFVTIGPIVHVSQTYATWAMHLYRQIYAAIAMANGFATQALGNIRTVKAFATEGIETKRYETEILVALRRGIIDAFGGAGMYTINSYLDLGAGVLILWYGGVLAMEGKDGLTPGRLITFQLYWNMLNNAYKGLLDILTSFTVAGAAAQRVFALMDSLPDIDTNKGLPVERVNGRLELIGVSFSYQMRPTHKVCKNMSLVIPAGSTCALVGKSGGGKSTIVSLLMRFYDPQEGMILLDGHDIRDLRLRDLRRHIGVVQQNTELFQGTIEENIAYGLEAGAWTRDEVIDAAKQACAHDFICSFPEGYATRVGERGIRISGGQRQRIAIARVFLRKPKILLLDEATSALDAESEAQVQSALDRLISKTDSSGTTTTNPTVILVAHRLSTIIGADNIAVIDNGVIIERGTHDELMAIGGVYMRLVEKQLKRRDAVVNADQLED